MDKWFWATFPTLFCLNVINKFHFKNQKKFIFDANFFAQNSYFHYAYDEK